MHRVLYDVIEREGIILEYAALSVTSDKLLGLYYIDNALARPIILLDAYLQGRTAEHDTVLGEEIGHHVTLPRTSLSTLRACRANRIVVSQDELRAVRWACNALIPDDDLREAIRKGYRETWEIAEYFQVTEWLVLQKYGHLRERSRSIGPRMLATMSTVGLEAEG